MTALAQRVVLLSLTTSAVILPLLLLSKRIQGRYRARSCYLLWLLLAVRLLLPVELKLARPVVTVEVPAAYTAVVRVPDPITAAPAGPAAATDQPPYRTVTGAEIAAAVWLAGTGLFLAWNTLGYLTVRRRLLRGAYQTSEDAALALEAAEDLGLARSVGVWRVKAVSLPMTLGCLRPLVLLPEDLTESADLELVLRHELCHVKRRDLWYKALTLLTNAVHWFNPVVWLMCREAGRNLEYCCDDAVVAGREADYRHRYGTVLLRRGAAEGGGPVLSTQFGGGGQMKGRIMNLFIEKKRGAAMLGLVAAVAVLSGSLVACESAAAAEPSLTPTSAPEAGVGLSVSPVEEWKGISLSGIPAEWAGQYRTEEHTEKDSDYLEFYYGAGEKMLFAIQISGEQVVEDRQFKLGRNGVEPGLLELGRREGKIYLLGYPRASVGDEQTYVDMLAQVPALAEGLRFGDDTVWQWPVSDTYSITTLYSERVHPITGQKISHDGTDIAAPEGTAVRAAAGGTVAEAGYNKEDGNYILLTHDGGIQTYYAALADLRVGTGDTVTRGQEIGTVGATGASTGAHLHLEFRTAGGNTDPLGYYPALAD